MKSPFTKQSLIFNSSFAFLNSFLLILINLFSKIILARFLTIEEFSIFVQLQNLFTFIIFVSSFSFGEYIVKYVSGHEPNLETNLLITKAASYSLLGISLIYLLITVLSFLGLKISTLDNLDLIFVGIFLTLALIKNIADLFGSAFQGLQKLYIKNIYLDLLPSLLFGFLLILLLIFKETSDSLLSGKIIALIYFLCLILPTFLLPKPFNFSVLINRKLNKVSKDSINKMFIFSTPLYLSGYLAWLLNLMPIIIAQFSSHDVVSYYVLSISLTVFIFMIIATIDISAFSAWSKKLSDNKVDEVSNSLKKYTVLSIYISSPLFAVLCLAPNEVVLLIFGEKYTEMSIFIPVFAATHFLLLFFGPIDAVLKASNNPKGIIIGRIVTGVIILFLSYPLISKHDLLGAAILFFISMIIAQFIKILYLYRKTSLSPFSIDSLKIILILSISIICTYFISISLFNLNGLGLIIVIFILQFILSSLFCVVLRLNYFFEFYRLIKQIF